MLAVSIVCYLIITILIGFWASRLVKNSEDFVLAGRSLPLPLAASAMFATWFGSETILGSSSEFVQHGLIGVVEDPFGAALCLLLVGVFFARPLYKMKILTFGDFYRVKFGKKAELIASLFLVPSYFGWIAAQFVAIGLILNVVLGIPLAMGMIGGTVAVLIYTYIGGMWAISITDFMQTIIIVAGLLFLAFSLSDHAGGVATVIDKAPEGFFNFTPEFSYTGITTYIAAWITIGLGSIPQQDVFQRVMAAKSADISVKASYISAAMYLTIGFIPLFIGLCSKQLYPELMEGDAQLVIPNVVLMHGNLFLQIMFFGALLSAIMSTSSGAILAPASILAENIIKPYMKNTDDKKLLQMMRLSVVLVTVFSLILANMQGNIFDLVSMSSAFSLVSLFIPMIAGLYFPSFSEKAAILSMFSGMTGWLIFEHYPVETPSILIGLLFAFVGLMVGRLFPKSKNTEVKENV
ncbi:sodium:solute symporter family protein [Chondrinema litorale]|uniref:sodium:solute symporter family protein n=1 Tax=Chondrinema litorale TaxID=2994555 RepID=UPI002543543F|nr:sodium:solute symporter family protein [Chondrinema litorale]UZR93899.1 sodium:solute symporter family protein [Chondrinema litorale]